MTITWKKTDINGNNLEYLATGRHKLKANSRMSLENLNDQGSTLALDFVTREDVGYYICEISSSPPVTLRHQVSLIGTYYSKSNIGNLLISLDFLVNKIL